MLTILNHVLFGEFTHELTDVYVIHHVSYPIRKTPHSSMICSLRVGENILPCFTCMGERQSVYDALAIKC